MLRRVKKDQNEGELIFDSSPNLTQKNNNTSLFSIPGLFVGFSAKALSDCDSARSPTSPLDSRVFSGLASSWWSQRSDLESPSKQRKCWCSKGVGLGIVGSLADVKTHCLQNFEGKSESKNILLGSQLKLNPQCKENRHFKKIGSSVTSPKSLPTYGFSAPTRPNSGFPHVGSSQFAIESDPSLFKATESNKCQSCSSESIAPATGFVPDSSLNHLLSDFDKNNNACTSGFPQSKVGDHQFSTSSSHSLNGGLSVNKIELSEDYTCVITHGPNPKTKHIYGDFVLEEDHMFETPVCNKPTELEKRAESPGSKSFPLDDFLSVCYGCRNKLLEDKDIYMYRGEKAFCSPECRLQEIMLDGGMEGTTIDSSPPSKSASHDKILFPGAAVTPQDRLLAVQP